ncbi:MAG: N-acetylmuramoyl-L-alanine amidase [Acutalibacteraceae bacterium]|nr:N-acetylmuramoyl-L-alanine amidase [Acutalibacteraceae bacterium]
MVVTKKELIKYVIISLTVIFSTVILLFGCSTAINVNTTSDELPTIIIDAGHGGEDGGAVAGDGTNEKDINMQIAQNLNTMFQSGGFKTVMTRTSDIAIYDEGCSTIKDKKVSDMHNRLEIFNKDENSIIISIHQNKFEQEKYNGTQLFYSPNNEKSEVLAESIRLSVTGMLQPDNTRENKKATKDIYLLYNCKQPSVIVECGFLSNNAELEKLKTEDYQQQMAFSIYCGCIEYIINSDMV